MMLAATATATALPVDETAEGGAAGAVNAAESKINALVEKVGKFGIVVGIFVCSLIYTIAAGTACFGFIACVGASGYAFAVGLLSAIVASVYVALMRFTQVSC